MAMYLPVAMLAALVGTDLFTVADPAGGAGYGLDWRVCAGVTAAAVALLLRQPFLVVFAVAITVTALLRALS
jgi:branched-subunit amino acid transport protein